MDKEFLQEVLSDKLQNGKERPWRDKRLNTQYTAIAYDDVDIKKADRLRGCACNLVFLSTPQGKKLKAADFCRVRLCPMCMWRRGLKIFSQTLAITRELEKERPFGYLFLTLTVKNCKPDDLSSTIDSMNAAWNRFIKLKAVNSITKGWMRILEVTHNVDEMSKDYDTYHTHFHVVLVVNKNYFNNTEYIPQAVWTAMWQNAAKLDYKPIVDIRRIKSPTASAIAEAAKYAVKDNDYIIPHDWQLSIDSVRILDSALHKRRLVAYGGKMKLLHKKLNLDNPEDGDLINVDPQQLPEDSGVLVKYSWSLGYQQYIKSNML